MISIHLRAGFALSTAHWLPALCKYHGIMKMNGRSASCHLVLHSSLFRPWGVQLMGLSLEGEDGMVTLL